MTWSKRFVGILVVGTLMCLGTIHASASGVDPDAETITVPLPQEPRTLNSVTAESVSYTAQVMVHVQEGLMRYDRRGRLAGGVASEWSMTASEIRFRLRGDARWQNGEPVTAQDFVFAWQRLVSPDTASPSANLASPIRNASAILAGKRTPDTLGVVAPDERTLIVQLAHPCSWCLKLMTNSIFYPVNETFYSKVGEDAYGTGPSSHLSNGPFRLARWSRGKQIELARHEHYWGRKRVNLQRILFDYIGSDAKTQLNLYRSGALAVAYLDRDTTQAAIEEGLRIRTSPTGHLMHIQFSHVDGMSSANEHLRKAIALVIDKDEIVSRIVASPGTRVADSMFHDWLKVGNTVFLETRPVRPHDPDQQQAIAHLARARQALGTDDIEVTLTVSDSSLYRRIAEYLQSRLAQVLDIKVRIDPQITQMAVQKWREGTSDMVLTTWPVDVDDPMDQISFMGNPDFRAVFKGLYAGDDMAAIYYTNRNALDIEARLDAVEAAHDLFTSRVTVFPLLETYNATLIDSRLRGYRWQPVRGYADFRYAQIIP